MEINDLIIKNFIKYKSIDCNNKKILKLKIINTINEYNEVTFDKLLDEMKEQLKNIQDRISKYGLLLTFLIGFITYFLSNIVSHDVKSIPDALLLDVIVFFIFLIIILLFIKPLSQKLYTPKFYNYNNLYKILTDMKYEKKE